jgi:hypothetical protein
MSTAQELGRAALARLADERTNAAVEQAEAGATWVFDPHVPDVVALVVDGTANRALVVVWLAQDDFAVDDRLGV